MWLWQSRLLLGRQSVWELVYLRRQHHVAYFRNLWAEINRLALPNECPFDVPWPGTVYAGHHQLIDDHNGHHNLLNTPPLANDILLAGADRDNLLLHFCYAIQTAWSRGLGSMNHCPRVVLTPCARVALREACEWAVSFAHLLEHASGGFAKKSEQQSGPSWFTHCFMGVFDGSFIHRLQCAQAREAGRPEPAFDPDFAFGLLPHAASACSQSMKERLLAFARLYRILNQTQRIRSSLLGHTHGISWLRNIPSIPCGDGRVHLPREAPNLRGDASRRAALRNRFARGRVHRRRRRQLHVQLPQLLCDRVCPVDLRVALSPARAAP